MNDELGAVLGADPKVIRCFKKALPPNVGSNYRSGWTPKTDCASQLCPALGCRVIIAPAALGPTL
jgi:hypothetical protein